MRLTRRLDTLARRLPPEPTSGEDAINRAVFARYQQETDAARAAAAPIDYDAYTREFEAAYAERGETLLEEMGQYFTAMMAQEEAEHGPWMTVEGYGRIRERDYHRLKTHVTGGRHATAPTP